MIPSPPSFKQPASVTCCPLRVITVSAVSVASLGTQHDPFATRCHCQMSPMKPVLHTHQQTTGFGCHGNASVPSNALSDIGIHDRCGHWIAPASVIIGLHFVERVLGTNPITKRGRRWRGRRKCRSDHRRRRRWRSDHWWWRWRSDHWCCSDNRRGLRTACSGMLLQWSHDPI